jgi:hypothetical protein
VGLLFGLHHLVVPLDQRPVHDHHHEFVLLDELENLVVSDDGGS